MPHRLITSETLYFCKLFAASLFMWWVDLDIDVSLIAEKTIISTIAILVATTIGFFWKKVLSSVWKRFCSRLKIRNK